MEIPPNEKIFELTASHMWLSKEGILYSKPKPGVAPEQTNEEITAEMVKIRKITGDKKVCLVSESSSSSKPPKKEQRDFIANEISSLVKALAIITPSPVSRMLANLFFSFKPPSYPVKMFTNEKEATEWIRQYL